MTDEERNRRKSMLTELFHDKAYHPMKLKELAIFLDVPKEKREELEEVLDQLVAEGKAGVSKKGRYGKPVWETVRGTFSATAKGFGFVTVPGREEDIFIPADKTKGAMHGDTVEVSVKEAADGRRAEGVVVKILERANTTVIGLYRKNKNYGFVIPDNRKLTQDVFIPAGNDMGAVTGHKVAAQITGYGNGRQNPEGKITEILGHVNDPGVDILSIVRAYDLPEEFPAEVMEQTAGIADSVRMKPAADASNCQQGAGSVFPEFSHGQGAGNVLPECPREQGAGDVLPECPREQGIGNVLPECPCEQDVHENATERYAVVQTENSHEQRLDLRHLRTVTIDGEDAKDLDDAVTISKESDDHYTLGVHIADVSHYVTEGSPLDLEAKRRGTSVYLVDRVIPMLPHKLSNGICSLNAGEDRLALSCIMEIDGTGTVIGHRIAETVIRVDRRMTYTPVNAIITDRDTDLIAEYDGFVEMFDLMKELADLLRAKRGRRGSINFDFPESKITLDGRGRPVEIRPYERNAATKIIEDFMLMANETVAEDYFWQEIPFLYRTHEEPDPEKMKKLAAFINNFGYVLRIPNGEVHPKEVQKLLAKIEGTPEEALLSRMTLRSMKQAKYTTECTGHFGLAARYYTHFTSPIRRYPDLQIHRIIKENLHGGLTERRIAHYANLLPEVAVQSSALERRADEAERETEKLKKCEYMSRHIGEIFDGVISGITSWGIYVELPNTVEGMVRVSDLEGDYFIFDESKMEMVGELTNRRYQLGQKVTVQVAGTDKLMRTIDFVLEQDGAGDF